MLLICACVQLFAGQQTITFNYPFHCARCSWQVVSVSAIYVTCGSGRRHNQEFLSTPLSWVIKNYTLVGYLSMHHSVSFFLNYYVERRQEQGAIDNFPSHQPVRLIIFSHFTWVSLSALFSKKSGDLNLVANVYLLIYKFLLIIIEWQKTRHCNITMNLHAITVLSFQFPVFWWAIRSKFNVYFFIFHDLLSLLSYTLKLNMRT